MTTSDHRPTRRASSNEKPDIEVLIASTDNIRQNHAICVELPRRASRRLRVAEVALRLTVRRFFNFAVWANHRRLAPKLVVLWITNRVDRLAVVLRPPRGTQLQRNDFPDFRAEWVWHPASADPPDATTGAVLYFHGGGLVSCGLNTHRRLVARLSRVTALPVYHVEYRKIPKAHVTDSISDCLRAYRRLLHMGIPAERIVLAGDSAGGGLVFSTALKIRDCRLPTPAGLVAISPLANYDSTVRANHPNDKSDPALSAAILEMLAKWGVWVDGVLDPAWSPVNHEFIGLPPTLIQVGSTEVLLADAYELAERCVAASVPLRFQVWDHAFHVFHAGADIIPDSQQAFSEIGSFVDLALARPNDDRRNAADSS